MKVAVVNNYVPFLRGGAEFLADSLVSKLAEYGHEPLHIKIPFKWYPSEKVLDHILACRLIKLESVDRVIALKFPAYYIKHENKVLWLLHQFRQAYDLWGTPFQDIPNNEEGLRIRQTIIDSDNTYFQEVVKIYTNSEVTSQRLKSFNGIESEVLYPPLISPELYHCDSYGDFIFYPSRLSPSKRQHLLLESLQYTKNPVRVVLAGDAEDSEYCKHLNFLVEKHGLSSRVTLLSFISQEEKAKLFSEALGCAYLPYNEDSYGYVTLEAFHSKKTVVTCTDSGGTHILVKHEETGYVVEPDPQQIAKSIDQLYQEKSLARKLGQAGFDALIALHITWDNVIQRLTV